MSEHDDIDHMDRLNDLSELEKSPGWKIVAAKFAADMADLEQRILETAAPADVPLLRELRRQLKSFGPTEILETLKSTHRTGASKQAPVVPKPKR